jgi:class 3 adenylate cyclase
MSSRAAQQPPGDSPLVGERKPVTAVFADVVGSTTLAERLDPEDWSQIINGAFGQLSAAVHRYDGVVTQLVGDGLLAIFGAPVAHEDDPARAAKAGLEMVAAIGRYARTLDPEIAEAFKIRVGINTGPVVVSRIGSKGGEEYTALGDAVNVAARLQAAAPPGSVLVTGATHRLIGPDADFRPLGTIEMRGKSEPVEAFEVLAVGESAGRTRGIPGLASPMVGRDVELEQLIRAYDTARAGAGRMAVVLGEPGIGKSRMLAELRQRVAADGVAWHEGRSPSYGQSLPYHLVSAVVRSVLRLPAEGNSVAEVRSALRGMAPNEEEEDSGRLLAHLLTLPLADDDAAALAHLDPESLAARYLLAVRGVLLAAASHPLVVVCEDIHWADSASVRLLTRLLPVVGRVPLLLVCASRADRDAPGWQLLSSAREQLGESLTELELRPLSDDHGRALIANLLAIESLTDRTRAEILRRADGNPFFVEEIVRMLIDRGAIVSREGRWMATPEVESVEIPESIHGLLLARIDRLPGDARELLRVASVIGRQFPLRVLEEVARG